MARGRRSRQGRSRKWKLKVAVGSEVRDDLGSTMAAGEQTREGTSLPYAALKGRARLGRTTYRSYRVHRCSGRITSSCLRPPGCNNLMAGSLMHSKGTQVLSGLEGAWVLLWALEDPSPNCKDTRSDKDGSSFLARVVSPWKPKEGLGNERGNWKEGMTKCIKKKSLPESSLWV